jgi:hypothetical protein
MGLTIQSAAEFLLEPANDRSVALPSIALMPTPENLPHVKKLEVETTGRSLTGAGRWCTVKSWTTRS